MKYQTLRYRLKTIEFWTLVLLLLAGSFFLIQALSMPLEMRRTIGPGFIPTIVLVVLLTCTLVALTKLLFDQRHKVFANFSEGSEDDTTFKVLIQALDTQPGPRMTLSSHTGLGHFSALSVTKRSHPDTSLLAASSRATQTNAELAAQEHLQGFAPLSLLYFDAFILAVRSEAANTPRETLSIGYDELLEDTVFLEKLRGTNGSIPEAKHWQAMNMKALHSALTEGRVDAALAARSELEEFLQTGVITVEKTFDGNDAEDGGLIYGEWAALFTPMHQGEGVRQAHAGRLRDAAQASTFTAQLKHVQVPWLNTDGEEAQKLLQALATQGRQGVTVKARPAHGRAYAIPITLAAIALFPFLMNIVGFITTSILVSSLIMALLRAELSLAGLLRVVAINAAIAVSTYMIFYHVFSIPLPLGSVW